MLDRLDEDEYADRRKENPYYPFEDEGEWDLGRFLVENLNQTQINKFLKLKWVSANLSERLYGFCFTFYNHSLTLGKSHHSPQKISY